MAPWKWQISVSRGCLSSLFVLLAPAAAAAQEVFEEVIPFNWDLISLEQNNPRFNASVLSGFHSVRSPGVSPNRAWKTGLGVLYTRAQQVAVASNTKLFSREQVIMNPKINYGFFDRLEAGAGFEGSYATGKEIRQGAGNTVESTSEEAIEASAVGLGAKWGFFQGKQCRLALSFDSRVAVNRGAFGALPTTIYNFELDGDYALTSRFGLIGNIQFLTNDHPGVRDQVLGDLAAAYSFSDRFRGMLFGTALEDQEADDIVLFSGVAGQYVFEQHSFTLALDLQLTEADRDIRTQRQLDIELSYTFTF